MRIDRAGVAAIVFAVFGGAVAAQGPGALAELFESLPQRQAAGELPSTAELQRVHQWAIESPLAEVAADLPTVVAALSDPDEYVRAQAAAVFVVIGSRPDGDALLEAEIARPETAAAIARLAASSEPREQSVALWFLANFRGRSSPDLLQPLLDVLLQPALEPRRQLGALAAVSRLAPEQGEVVAAVEVFASRPLDDATRVEMLKTLQLSRIDSGNLRVAVIQNLAERNAAVKTQAIAVLTRMGPTAISSAAQNLREIAERPEESQSVRDAALAALQGIE
jgi:hypothetical protein